MRITSRAAVMFASLALGTLVASGPVASQANGGAVAADTTKPKVDSTAAERFAPMNSSYVKGTDVDIRIGNVMNAKIDPGKGWILSNLIMMERRRYRARVGEDIVENIGGRAAKTESGAYAFDFGIGQSYSKNKTYGLGRFGKEIIYRNNSADLNFNFSKPLLGASQSLLAIRAEGRQGMNDFKYDRSLSGAMNSSLNYAFGDLLAVSGGFGTIRRREASEIGSRKFSAMPTSGDTLRAGLEYGKGQAKVLVVSYLLSDGVERSVMPPLGNSLEILSDASKATQEKVHHKGEEFSVNSAIAPMSFLSFDFQFQHKLASQDYAVQKNLSSGSENTDLTANTTYRYANSGTISVKVSTSKSSSDYGPNSLSNFNERTNTVGMNLSQKISDSISVNLSGTGYLRQRFFTKEDVNPRDADNLYYHGEADLKASPLPRISTGVAMAADRYETININGTLSGDNRVDYTYRVGPTITLRPTDWVSISQDYNVKIEYTDFVYQQDKNYLNRTTTLNSRANFIIFPSLAFNFRHSYLMKDTGSYLMREGERRYNRGNENREHSVFLDMKYDVQRDFTIRAQADFKTQRSNIFGLMNGRRAVVTTSLTDSGGMRVGFVRNKKIGGAGGINLDVSYVRRYGPYITKERKEYWDVNSSVTLKF